MTRKPGRWLLALAVATTVAAGSAVAQAAADAGEAGRPKRCAKVSVHLDDGTHQVIRVCRR